MLVPVATRPTHGDRLHDGADNRSGATPPMFPPVMAAAAPADLVSQAVRVATAAAVTVRAECEAQTASGGLAQEGAIGRFTATVASA
jgi:hypothetical protein